MKEKEQVSLVSLGCPKNLVDTEVMLGSLIEDGYRISRTEEDAEIIIVNTCSFIEAAKEESIDTILELAELKENGNCHILAVTGCLPQRYGDELAKELPEVDIFIGTGEFQRIVEILERYKKSKSLSSIYRDEPRFLYNHNTPRLNTGIGSSAYVKIAEGCSNSCSYCVIGEIRGELRSRIQDSIIKEVDSLVNMGVREINLIAQDTTMYGKDLGRGVNLEGLLRKLSKSRKPEWIRILYTHPDHFTDGLIKAIKEEERVCKYVDLPIQHISDRILKAMNRKTTGKSIRKLIWRLRQEIPDVCIRTSLIVGFPGETDKEFQELMEFVKDVEFERLGVFEYSREEGTLASGYPDQIPNAVKKERHQEVMEAQKEISLRNNRKLIGTQTQVLVQEVDEETGLVIGRTPHQAPDIDGVTYIAKSEVHIGEIYGFVVTDATEYDLIGETISCVQQEI